ncbi:MAG TPA: DUF2330 domain-containing protein [Kofleriaceae bacterium]|nr:DUF2330 domain-containing protein [Kofleriaceae bacterium]
MSWLTVIVLGRILAESGSPPPDVDDQTILLIKRKDVMVGCSPGDAGVDMDAASDAPDGDAAIGDAALDDAGVSDAGIGDAGVDDAGVDASTCTMISGDAVTLVVQPHVSTSADGTRFAVLLVTPDRPIVELAGDVFSSLAQTTAPRIDIHTVEVPDPALGQQCATYESGCGGGESDGCGGDFGDDGSSWTPPKIGDAGLGDGGLVQEMIGPYQFVRAQPTSAMELAGWLDQFGYAYMQKDLDAVAPYIALGYHVVAIRVSLDHPLTAPMIPISLTWAGSELRVPAALGAGAVGTGTLTVYIAAEGKYQFPNATIRFARQTSAGGAGYLTRNQITLDQNLPPEQDPIAYRVTNSDFQEVTTQTEYVHVPVDVDCSQQEERGGCCNECNAKPRNRLDLLTIVVAVAFVLRRRRR